MKRITMVVVVALAVAAGGWIASLNTSSPVTVTPAWADVTPAGEELSIYMGTMQRHMHKLGLAIDAGNKDLAAFYVRELGEAGQQIESKFKDYDGFQIGMLLKAMLTPTLGPVDEAIKAGNMAGASTKYDAVVTACNSCHVATQHAYVKIARVKTNPYNQDFK